MAKMSEPTIRLATPEDAPALLAIYEPYVRQTAITCEYEVPSVEEFAGRIERTLKRYPYLVMELDGRPVGYAYVSPLNSREAYDWSVETSIYLARDVRHGGLGRKLHDALKQCLVAMGITNMCALIAVPHDKDDEYLTHNSQDFHAHMGYRLVGAFDRCAQKFGRWYDMCWMELVLAVFRALTLKTTTKVPVPIVVVLVVVSRWARCIWRGRCAGYAWRCAAGGRRCRRRSR